GFETFISEIFDVIERVGTGGCYVFDCLSELAVDWYSDRMLGNFFRLTCPYLYTFETITYFALLRNRHTNLAIEAIHHTAQVVIDVYRNRETLYVHPLKVYKRHSETMYMLHSWEKEKFIPVTRSATISEILSSVPQPWLDFSILKYDVWTETFLEAQEVVDSEKSTGKHSAKTKKLLNKLLRMAVSREERLLKLCEKYFDLADLLEIEKRMIGSGLVGGKTVGMLLSRAILKKNAPRWNERLEAHDSFYIGSDVFYSYLILNGCWWVRRRLRNPAYALDGALEARQRLLTGTFPKDIQNQFMAMLDYFGQSPIIVRSSSLLEDAYGNAFSGKYESVFCANQGTPQERLEHFMTAVRRVYASTMSRDALSYRAHWGLLEQDEQMALLIQRVSGEVHGKQFYPHVAGVGFSFNPFVWNKKIDPSSGMIRLVFGLGTRAVDRTDDDYTRVVALNAPGLRPEANFEEVKKYAQRRVDVLDLKANQHVSRYFDEVAKSSPQLPLDIFASKDEELVRRASEMNRQDFFPYVLTFDSLLSQTEFVDRIKEMLAMLESAYEYPVDVEFTANFLDPDVFRINLLQCRPFQVKGKTGIVSKSVSIPKEQVLLQTEGPIIGNSLDGTIDRCIYISPEIYGGLSMNDRYAVARLIGRLTHLTGENKAQIIMLVGPGRWGTSMPALGIPVSFAEINSVKVLCELAMMHQGLVPDVSLGTHFFNDLVEMDMLYMALHPERKNHVLNHAFFNDSHNRLSELLPDSEKWSNVVKVIDSATSGGKILCLNVDSINQKGLCYFNPV
ncbi:MAG: PEP/pyruvate-binding domain-containing protein, partial [Candidatus Aureabacteria bacterium]|nr:PEP/pyruvate-binding domain-containing protein [Candidatus Auribacterota bacterium]